MRGIEHGVLILSTWWTYPNATDTLAAERDVGFVVDLNLTTDPVIGFLGAEHLDERPGVLLVEEQFLVVVDDQRELLLEDVGLLVLEFDDLPIFDGEDLGYAKWRGDATTSPGNPRSLRRRRCGGVKWVVGPCCASLCRSDFGGRPTRELLGEGRSR